MQSGLLGKVKLEMRDKLLTRLSFWMSMAIFSSQLQKEKDQVKYFSISTELLSKATAYKIKNIFRRLNIY